MDENTTTESSEVIEPSSEWDKAFADDPVEETKAEPKAEETDEGEAQEPEQEPEKEAENETEKPSEPGSGEKEKDPETAVSDQEKKADEGEPWTLKHLDDPPITGRGVKDLLPWASKGRDYDRVRSELDTLKADKAAAHTEHEDFLQELADAAGVSVEDAIDSLRVDFLVATQGLAKPVAEERISGERKLRESQRDAKARESGKNEAVERAKKDFLAFTKARPEVTKAELDALPAEVWQRCEEGMSLGESYAMYENQQLREENTRLKNEASAREQEQKNKARSTGSRKSAGAGKPEDLWEKYLS